MKPMRVLVVHPWIRVGGAETLILQFAREMTRLGHHVRVATCYAETSLLTEDYDEVEFVLPWRWISRLSTRSLFLICLFGGPALVWLAVKHAKECDVIYPHNFPALWVACIASVIRRKPVVWQFNEPTPPPLPAWFTLIDRRLTRLVRRIAVLDEPAQAKVRSLFGREADVVNPGVDFEFFAVDSAEAGRRIGADLGLAGRRILLTLGKVDRQKNQAMLVEVLNLLRDEMPELSLVLVGRGPQEAWIAQRAAELKLGERVIRAGHLGAGDVRALYAAAFLVCFPALDQTWGLTPIEALAQCRVSVVSTEAGVSDVLRREGIGLVAEPAPEGFAEQIRAAAADPGRIADMGRRGQAYVRERLTWRSFAEGMARVLGDVAVLPVAR